MLTIRYINPTGLFSYGLSANIDIERRGLVNLIGVNDDTGGDSNGSGKSSLFNALCEVLYGDNPTGVSGNGVVNNVWDSGYAGRVEFVSWEGVYYRVTSCREWKEEFYAVDTNTGVVYKGTELFFEKYAGDHWVDCRGARMSETRKLILDALGITYNRFVSISYLSHRVGSRFLRGTNKERVDILAGITGVEEWDRILSRCRIEKADRAKEVIEVEQQISYQRGALEQLQTQLQELETADWESRIAEYTKQLAEVEKVDADALAQVDKLVEQSESLSQQQRDIYAQSGITGLSQEISDLAKEEAHLRNPANLEDQLPSFDPTYEQRVQTARSNVDRARGGVTVFLRDGDLRDLENCPTCAVKITKTRKAEMGKHLKHLQDEVTRLEGEFQKEMEIREVHHKEIQDARAKAYEERNAVADRIAQQIEEKRRQMEASSSEYERLTEEIRQISIQISQLQSERARVQGEMSNLKGWIDQGTRALEGIEQLRQQMEDRSKQITEMESSISTARGDLSVLDWLISNIPYIKLHRLSVTMSALSEKVNQHLAEMGDTIRVNISSFEEKKSKRGAADAKDLLKSDVKVEIIDGEKNIDPRLYSDGETAKIANALIRGLHEMALQGGHGCNVILLDEIFAFVDVTNSQRLVDSFTSIGTSTTLVTDNSGHVNDLLPFSEVWTARKQNGITTLGVAQ